MTLCHWVYLCEATSPKLIKNYNEDENNELVVTSIVHLTIQEKKNYTDNLAWFCN